MDHSKEREGKRGREQEHRSVYQISEDRQGESRGDIRKISLKTDRETESREPTDLHNRSLQKDGETDSGEPI